VNNRKTYSPGFAVKEKCVGKSVGLKLPCQVNEVFHSRKSIQLLTPDEREKSFTFPGP